MNLSLGSPGEDTSPMSCKSTEKMVAFLFGHKTWILAVHSVSGVVAFARTSTDVYH